MKVQAASILKKYRTRRLQYRKRTQKRHSRWLYLHRPITLLYKRGSHNTKQHRGKYQYQGNSKLFADFLLSSVIVKRFRHPFHLFMPYYASKTSIPVTVVPKSINMPLILRNFVLFSRSMHTMAIMLFTFFNACKASVITSAYTSIVCMRHVMLSFMYVGAVHYHRSASLNAYQVARLHRDSYPALQRIVPAMKYDLFLVSFLFKLYYCAVIGAFIVTDFLTLDFFLIMISISKNRDISYLFRSRQICLRFNRYLNGQRSFSSRIIFFIHRTITMLPYFFICWFFSKYCLLSLRMYISNIKYDIYYYITMVLLHGGAYNGYIYILIQKIAHIYISCKHISNCISELSRNSFYIKSYIFNRFSFSTYIYRFHSAFFRVVLDMNILSIFQMLRKKALHNLTLQIEYSLYSHHHVKHFLMARFYYRSVPPITNAKMLCDYILIQLSNGLKIKDVFGRIFRWQKHWQRIYDNNSVGFMRKFALNIGNFLYPLKGIRIVCSGPPYKARRTTSSKYHI